MSCLFDSLAALLAEGGDAGDGAALRARVCEYMLDHLDREHAHGMTLRAWLHMVLEDDRRVGMRILAERQRRAVTEEVDRDARVLRYIEWMRAHDTWGGALELSLVARMCRVNIRVLDARGHSVTHALAAAEADVTDSHTRTLVLHYDGTHYTPHPSARPPPPPPPPPPHHRPQQRHRATTSTLQLSDPCLRQNPSVRHRQRHGPPNVGWG